MHTQLPPETQGQGGCLASARTRARHGYSGAWCQRGRRQGQRAPQSFSTSKTIERAFAQRPSSRQLSKTARLLSGDARRRYDAPIPCGVPMEPDAVLGPDAVCLAATGTPSLHPEPVTNAL
jgi:hypothetical protein